MVLKSESEFKTIVEGVKLAELLVNVSLIRFVLLDLLQSNWGELLDWVVENESRVH